MPFSKENTDRVEWDIQPLSLTCFLVICCQEWPKEFTLSDHRMIVTEFELETKENRQPDSQTSGQADSLTDGATGQSDRRDTWTV